MHALRAMHNTFVVAFAFLHRPSIYLTTSSCLSCRSLARCQKESSRRSFLVSSRQSRPRSNPVRRSCQILFSEIESNPIESNLGRKGITRVIYLHDIASQVKHRTDHQHDFAKKNKKIRASSKDCPIILLAADDGQRIVRVYVPLASIVLPLFSLTYSLLLESFDL